MRTTTQCDSHTNDARAAYERRTSRVRAAYEQDGPRLGERALVPVRWPARLCASAHRPPVRAAYERIAPSAHSVHCGGGHLFARIAPPEVARRVRLLRGSRRALLSLVSVVAATRAKDLPLGRGRSRSCADLSAKLRHETDERTKRNETNERTKLSPATNEVAAELNDKAVSINLAAVRLSTN